FLYRSHSENAGSYANVITCAPGNLSATNYDFATGSKGKLTISKAHLLVNADDQSKGYGDGDPAASYSFTGFVSGENAGNVTINGAASCSYGSHSENAGSYANVITCAPGNLSATNYDFATGSKGKLTISKAHLLVNADDQSKGYGDGDPAAS